MNKFIKILKSTYGGNEDQPIAKSALSSSNSPPPGKHVNATDVLFEEAAKNKSGTDLENAIYVSAVLGNLVVVGLAATGVGVPFAAMATALLALAKMVTTYSINFKKLHDILYDVINIIVYNFQLFEFINSTKEIIKKHLFELNNPLVSANNLEGGNLLDSKKIAYIYDKGVKGINAIKNTAKALKHHLTPKEREIIENREYNTKIENKLMEKLKTTIMHIIKLVDYEILKKLVDSQDIDKISILKQLLVAELKERDKKILAKIKFMNIGRTIQNKLISYSNFMDGSAITLSIVSDLSVINGYFNILKSRFDLLLARIEFKLTNHRGINKEKYKIAWIKIYEEILISEKYEDFMDDEKNLDTIVTEAVEKNMDKLNEIQVTDFEKILDPLTRRLNRIN